ncbi:MAG TPA: gluconeogenesis factor YvcK family protein [Candidatus Kryptonia bacterium]|nr:gluconeogenesis factor YvcK family protein [Candidatus Kryptonia bacterium]
MAARPFRIVCIGGGTGLPIVLRGFRDYVRCRLPGWDAIDLDALTVVVSVSDDGGSSGRLMREYDTLPPGDLRNCLLALADETAEPVMKRFFDHRFDGNADAELAGHSAGNLLIIALAQVHGGDFRRAILDISRVLSIRGNILFPTLEPTILCARLSDGSVVRGESNLARRGNMLPIESVFLTRRNGHNGGGDAPYAPAAMPETLNALVDADAIVLGPGSLYTSVIPNLLAAGVSDAIAQSRARRIYVCNIMTEPGETDDYGVAEHVNAIRRHGGFAPDVVVVNRRRIDAAHLAQYASERLVREYEIVKESLESTVTTARQHGIGADSLIDLVGAQARKLLWLAEELRTISGREVQVLYDPIRDRIEPPTRLHEIDGISEVEIVDQGKSKTVIRHDPVALTRAVLDVLNGER